MTVLWFAPKPARNSCAITRTSGNRSCTAAAEPSSDALSSTTTSASAPRSDSRHASRRSRLFVLTIETATSRTQALALARETAGEQRLARGVDAVGCLLCLEPREQVVHSGVEGDLRAEAEQLVGQPRVGVAMPDVAGAVLIGDLGLDVLPETPRDHLGDLEHRRGRAGADVERPPVGPVLRQRQRAATRDV